MHNIGCNVRLMHVVIYNQEIKNWEMDNTYSTSNDFHMHHHFHFGTRFEKQILFKSNIVGNISIGIIIWCLCNNTKNSSITNDNQLKNYNGREEFDSYSIINAILARITQCSISKFNAILKTFFQGLHDKTLEIKMSHLYMFWKSYIHGFVLKIL